MPYLKSMLYPTSEYTPVPHKSTLCPNLKSSPQYETEYALPEPQEYTPVRDRVHCTQNSRVQPSTSQSTPYPSLKSTPQHLTGYAIPKPQEYTPVPQSMLYPNIKRIPQYVTVRQPLLGPFFVDQKHEKCVTHRLFAIPIPVGGWKTCNDSIETDEPRNPRPTNPRVISLDKCNIGFTYIYL